MFVKDLIKRLLELPEDSEIFVSIDMPKGNSDPDTMLELKIEGKIR